MRNSPGPLILSALSASARSSRSHSAVGGHRWPPRIGLVAMLAATALAGGLAMLAGGMGLALAARLISH